jgi:flagellin-like protein
MKILRSRKALSPVVASIILIAVTVAVSIAVAAWMGALSFNFMSTEQLTFTSYAWGTSSANFDFIVKNTGATTVTLQDVRIDGNAASSVAYKNSTSQWVTFTVGTTTLTMIKGDTVEFNVTRTNGFTSGIQYEFAVITAKGNTFGPFIKTAP